MVRRGIRGRKTRVQHIEEIPKYPPAAPQRYSAAGQTGASKLLLVNELGAGIIPLIVTLGWSDSWKRTR